MTIHLSICHQDFHIATTVLTRITVKQFCIKSRLRHANTVVRMRLRCKLHTVIMKSSGSWALRINATLWRLSVNPLKPRLLKILIMQSWSGAVDMVEICTNNQLLWACCNRCHPSLPDIPLHPLLHPIPCKLTWVVNI